MEQHDNFTEQDRLYMRRCIQLAKLGKGAVSPNPMVGAIIVCDGKIIGEGFHAQVGKAHAEVNAIQSVRDEAMLKRSTLYVSLEPCSHYGKTPPCADLIIRMGIPRVTIGCLDPFPKVSGRGVKKMLDAGIEVNIGLLQQECEQLLSPFSTPILHNRPYIILKWAETADGFIDILRTANAPHRPTPISNEQGRRVVHKLRSEVDAIMVGTETAILDNPTLNVRHWSGSDPIRIAIDRSNRIPRSARLLDGSIPTWIFTRQPLEDTTNVHYLSISSNDEELPILLQTLCENKIQTLLIEGGARLLTSFIEAGLYDEIRIERSNIRFGQGVTAPKVPQTKYKESNRL